MVLFVTAETETDSSDTPNLDRELMMFVASGTRRFAVVMPSEKSVQLSLRLPRTSVVRVRGAVSCGGRRGGHNAVVPIVAERGELLPF